MKEFFAVIFVLALVSGQSTTTVVPGTPTPSATIEVTPTATPAATVADTPTPTDSSATSTTVAPTETSTSTPNVTETPLPNPSCSPLPLEPLCGTKTSDGQGISIYSLGPQVCLVIVGSADCSITTPVYTTQNKTVFRPKVDDFVALQVANSHTTNLTYGRWIAATDVHFRLEIANFTTPWKRRFSMDGNFVVPFWTALVEAHRGTITGIEWDDGCFACDDNACVNQTCAVNMLEECYEATIDGTAKNDKPTNCDLTAYLGWKGSDKEGNIFTSNAKRLSAFRSYSVSKVYYTARQNAPAIDPKVPCLSESVQGCTKS